MGEWRDNIPPIAPIEPVEEQAQPDETSQPVAGQRVSEEALAAAAAFAGQRAGKTALPDEDPPAGRPAGDDEPPREERSRRQRRERQPKPEFESESAVDSNSAATSDSDPAAEPEFTAPLRTTRTGEPKKTKGRGQKVKEKAYEKTPDRFKNASSFQIRLRTGIVYVGLNVICILVSDLTTMLVLAATAAVCAGEFYYMLRADAKMPNEVIGIIAAAAYPVAVFFFGTPGILSVTFLLVLAVTFWYVYWLRARMSDVGVCLFGAMYTGMQLSCLLLIRMAVGGIEGGLLVLIIFLSIWANDAFAYLIGSKFGKHKMAPRVSPNKSWEGFIAGIVFSMLFWCLIVLVPGVNASIPQALLFGLVCGLTSVMGDLCESRVKRSVGFKDSGTIMPGHGGLFDRCDSLMPTAVTAAFLLFAFGCIPFV